jgi:arginyl-tRNA synthetase
VSGDNHIGDWGTQFGMIIYGYKQFLNQEAFQQDAVGNWRGSIAWFTGCRITTTSACSRSSTKAWLQK